MAGPWDKFKTDAQVDAPVETGKPWERFATAEHVASAPHASLNPVKPWEQQKQRIDTLADDDTFDAASHAAQNPDDFETAFAVDKIKAPHGVGDWLAQAGKTALTGSTYYNAGKGLLQFWAGGPAAIGNNLDYQVNNARAIANYELGDKTASDSANRRALTAQAQAMLAEQGIGVNLKNVARLAEKYNPLPYFPDTKIVKAALGIKDQTEQQIEADRRADFQKRVELAKQRSQLAEGRPLDTGAIAAYTRFSQGANPSDLASPEALQKMGADPVNPVMVESMGVTADPMALAIPFAAKIPGVKQVAGGIVEGAGHAFSLPATIAEALPGRVGATMAATTAGAVGIGLGEIAIHNPALAAKIGAAVVVGKGLNWMGEAFKASGGAARKAIPSALDREVAIARLAKTPAKLANAQKFIGDTAVHGVGAAVGMAPLNAVLSEGDPHKFAESTVGAGVFGAAFGAFESARPQLVEAARPYLRMKGEESMNANDALGRRSAEFIRTLPEAHQNAALELMGTLQGMPSVDEHGNARPSRMLILNQADYNAALAQVNGGHVAPMGGGRGFFYDPHGTAYINGESSSFANPNEASHTMGHEFAGHAAVNMLRAATSRGGPIYDGLFNAVRQGLTDRNGRPTVQFRNFIKGYNEAFGSERLRVDDPESLHEYIAETAGQIIAGKGAAEIAMPKNLLDRTQDKIGHFMSGLIGVDSRKVGTPTHFNREELGAVTKAVQDTLSQLAGLNTREYNHPAQSSQQRIQELSEILATPRPPATAPAEEMAQWAKDQRQAHAELKTQQQGAAPSFPANGPAPVAPSAPAAPKPVVPNVPTVVPVPPIPTHGITPAMRTAFIEKYVDQLQPVGRRRPESAASLQEKENQAKGIIDAFAEAMQETGRTVNPQTLFGDVVIFGMDGTLPKASTSALVPPNGQASPQVPEQTPLPPGVPTVSPAGSNEPVPEPKGSVVPPVVPPEPPKPAGGGEWKTPDQPGLFARVKRSFDRKTKTVSRGVPKNGVDGTTAVSGVSINRSHHEDAAHLAGALANVPDRATAERTVTAAEDAIANGRTIDISYDSAELSNDGIKRKSWTREGLTPTDQERRQNQELSDIGLAEKRTVQKDFAPNRIEIAETNVPRFDNLAIASAKAKIEQEFINPRKTRFKNAGYPTVASAKAAVEKLARQRAAGGGSEGFTPKQAELLHDVLGQREKHLYLVGDSPDKTVSNAVNLAQAMSEHAGSDRSIATAADYLKGDQWQKDLVKRRENMANGYRGDGKVWNRVDAGQVVPQSTNPNFRPHIIPDFKVQILNLIEGGPSNTYFEEARANLPTVDADPELARPRPEELPDKSANPLEAKLIALGKNLKLPMKNGGVAEGLGNIVTEATETIRLDRIKELRGTDVLDVPPSIYPQRAAGFMPETATAPETTQQKARVRIDAQKFGESHAMLLKNDNWTQAAWLHQQLAREGKTLKTASHEEVVAKAKEWRHNNPDVAASSQAYPLPKGFLNREQIRPEIVNSDNLGASLAAYEKRSGSGKARASSIEGFRAAVEPLVKESERTGRDFSPRLLDLVGAQGGEHSVVFTPGRVLKFTEPDSAGGVVKFKEDGEPYISHGTFPEYASQIKENEAYGDDDSRIEGIVKGKDGSIRIVTSQTARNGVKPTYHEASKAFMDAGFAPVDQEYAIGQTGPEMWWNKAENIGIMDAKPDNLVKTDDGDIVPIDIKAFKPTGKALEWIKENADSLALAKHRASKPSRFMPDSNHAPAVSSRITKAAQANDAEVRGSYPGEDDIAGFVDIYDPQTKGNLSVPLTAGPNDVRKAIKAHRDKFKAQ